EEPTNYALMVFLSSSSSSDNELEIHGMSLSQEDVNLKFLRSLPSKLKTHTLIWRNKGDLEEQSLDDLFNSLKIYEAEVKHSSSTGTTTQNLAFVSSSTTDSTTKSVSVVANSLVPTRVVEGVLQPVAPITAEQKLARKNELKAHGTLLMALPDKYQLKFNSDKDAKTLMEVID
nr:ribonuclease H-like domain-containing protein [Tanacetum cinerariifolium]